MHSGIMYVILKSFFKNGSKERWSDWTGRLFTYLFQHTVQYQGHRNEFFWNWIQQIIVISHVYFRCDDRSHCKTDKTSLLNQDALSRSSIKISSTNSHYDPALTGRGSAGGGITESSTVDSHYSKAPAHGLEPPITGLIRADCSACNSSFCAFFFPGVGATGCGA